MDCWVEKVVAFVVSGSWRVAVVLLWALALTLTGSSARAVASTGASSETAPQMVSGFGQMVQICCGLKGVRITIQYSDPVLTTNNGVFAFVVTDVTQRCFDESAEIPARASGDHLTFVEVLPCVPASGDTLRVEYRPGSRLPRGAPAPVYSASESRLPARSPQALTIVLR